jgi:hypothetical protein
MNPSKDSTRRRRRTALGAEALESRELLTGGAGNTFAIIPATISKPGGTVSVSFTLDPAHFHLPRHSLALGIDVAPDSGSTVKPLITAVNDPYGDLIPQTFHSIYDPHATHAQAASGRFTSAVITPVRESYTNPSKPLTYTVQVQAQSNTSGNFMVGFYLPGDALGTGQVNAASIQAVKAALNTTPNNAKYNFNADANRDGRIGKIDLAYVLQNQGVTTDISPTVSANLNPADQVTGQDRVTNMATVNFTGTATPGASITYHNSSFASIPDVTTTADSSGNYSINVNLGLGSNTFHVTSMDAFGQTIQGDITPVTYDPNAKNV